jgi:hypothetical protein
MLILKSIYNLHKSLNQKINAIIPKKIKFIIYFLLK